MSEPTGEWINPGCEPPCDCLLPCLLAGPGRAARHASGAIHSSRFSHKAGGAVGGGLANTQVRRNIVQLSRDSIKELGCWFVLVLSPSR